MLLRIPPWFFFFYSWISSLPFRLSSPCAGCAGSALAQGEGNAFGDGCEEEVALLSEGPSLSPCLLWRFSFAADWLYF